MTQEKRFKLPREFAVKWLEALRSGKYEQGKDTLLFEDKHCCLGVACVIQGYTRGEILDDALIDSGKFLKVPRELEGSTLRNSKDFNGLVYILTDRNDRGASFLEIADWIEENVELYEDKPKEYEDNN